MAPRTALANSERNAPAQATHLGRTAPDHTISVSVIVRRKNPLKLSELKGQRLSHAEFNDKYAADPADFDSIRAFAKNHDLTVDETASSLARRTIVLNGTAEAMENAFGVELNSYEDQRHKRRFHAFTGKISLPEEHAPAVEAVLGLDSRPIAVPHLRRRDAELADPNRKKKHPAAPTPQPFSAVQVAKLYNFPSDLNGTGQTIGILELGGGYTDSDLETYFSGLGLKIPNVVSVSVDGGQNSPGEPNGADGEVELDIQVAGAVANGANIAVYFAPNSDQGFIDAITTAVHDTTNKPSVLSISWGGPESSWSTASIMALDNACQSAAALGVTITAASGDSGSSDGTNGTVVDFPASSPHVLACGGTALFGSGSTITEEIVWDDQPQGGATGGGFSTTFSTTPTWQASALPAGKSGRGVPDVSGDASPETGYNIVVDGQQEIVGGTSAVAPLYAGLIALVNEQLATHGAASVGFINPTLYGNPGVFYDITQGNNGAYSAGSGWDACTGLGSPNGTAILDALTAATSVAATPS
jgi:kumamolisin